MFSIKFSIFLTQKYHSYIHIFFLSLLLELFSRVNQIITRENKHKILFQNENVNYSLHHSATHKIQKHKSRRASLYKIYFTVHKVNIK